MIVIPELTEEDVKYIGIYIRFALNYIPIFIPCLLGSLAMEQIRKYHGSKDPPVSKKMILLSSAIVTFIVMGIDLLGVTANLRNEGLSIIIGFVGGILSRSIISAMAHDTFVSSMCKGFIEKNSSNGLLGSFAYALKETTSKNDEDDDSDDDSEETDDSEDSDEEPEEPSKSKKKTKPKNK